MLKEDGKNSGKMKIKSFIIGCGKIAGLYDEEFTESVYSHAKAYSLSPHFETVAYCDLDLNKAKTLARINSSESFGSDYLKMINIHCPDVVSICTPDATHYNVVSSILENKTIPKLIFLEKPACSNVKELEKLISLSERRDVKIIVNHTRRFENKHRFIKEQIRKSKFGNLLRVDISYYSGWQHNGVHVIDTLNFLFEDELNIVELNTCIDSPYENDPTANFVLEFANSGAKVFLHGWDESHYQIFDFDIKFDKSRLRIEDFGGRILYEKKIVNKLKENILVLDELEMPQGLNTPIQNAVEIIYKYFKESKSSLSGVLIQDVAETMNLIWKGKQWIQN
jgi:predicted dehydrogenase